MCPLTSFLLPLNECSTARAVQPIKAFMFLFHMAIQRDLFNSLLHKQAVSESCTLRHRACKYADKYDILWSICQYAKSMLSDLRTWYIYDGVNPPLPPRVDNVCFFTGLFYMRASLTLKIESVLT